MKPVTPGVPDLQVGKTYWFTTAKDPIPRSGVATCITETHVWLKREFSEEGVPIPWVRDREDLP